MSYTCCAQFIAVYSASILAVALRMVVMKWTHPLCGAASMRQNDFTTSETMQPQEASPRKPEMSVLGIDIAQRVLHAVGTENTGKIVFRKRLSRYDLMPFMAKLPPRLSGMEACGGAHSWARRFRAHGHEVQRMAPPF